MNKSIEILKLPSGKSPYSDWIDGIKDRIHFGPGYRIYFAELNYAVVILLCGGDKGAQKKDVKIAKQYWRELQEKLNE